MSEKSTIIPNPNDPEEVRIYKNTLLEMRNAELQLQKALNFLNVGNFPKYKELMDNLPQETKDLLISYKDKNGGKNK